MTDQELDALARSGEVALLRWLTRQEEARMRHDGHTAAFAVHFAPIYAEALRNFSWNLPLERD